MFEGRSSFEAGAVARVSAATATAGTIEVQAPMAIQMVIAEVSGPMATARVTASRVHQTVSGQAADAAGAGTRHPDRRTNPSCHN